MKFNFGDIDDFDKHIRSSIPQYDFIVGEVTNYVRSLTAEGHTYLDFGCSTGMMIDSIAKAEPNIQCIGIEPEESLGLHDDTSNLTYYTDINDIIGFKTSFITSLFTLQFLDHDERNRTLSKFKTMMMTGGHIIVCERVFYDSPTIEWITSNRYLQHKRGTFNDADILDKNALIGNTMHMKTETEFLDEMSAFGNEVNIFFKMYGFIGVIVRVDK